MIFEPDVVQSAISVQGWAFSSIVPESVGVKGSHRTERGMGGNHMIGAKRFSADFPKGLVGGRDSTATQLHLEDTR